MRGRLRERAFRLPRPTAELLPSRAARQAAVQTGREGRRRCRHGRISAGLRSHDSPSTANSEPAQARIVRQPRGGGSGHEIVGGRRIHQHHPRRRRFSVLRHGLEARRSDRDAGQHDDAAAGKASRPGSADRRTRGIREMASFAGGSSHLVRKEVPPVLTGDAALFAAVGLAHTSGRSARPTRRVTLGPRRRFWLVTRMPTRTRTFTCSITGA